jgi:hypothetical protein
MAATESAQPSPEPQTEGPTPARFWGDQWLRVSEKVLKGLNHQLTNRVAGLEAVVGIFQDGEPVEPQIVAALAQEVSRLNHLLHLFRCMPAEPFVGAEPVRLQDIVPQVLELHGHHADLRVIAVDVAADMETLPLLVRPSALLRCLLVVLESGAGNALRAGSSGEGGLTLSYSGDATWVTVVFEAPQPEGQPIFTGEGARARRGQRALHAFAQWVPPWWGARPGSASAELRLPTLSRGRRLERESATADQRRSRPPGARTAALPFRRLAPGGESDFRMRVIALARIWERDSLTPSRTAISCASALE